MARLVFVCAVALTAVLATATVASATHSPGNGPNKDLIAGTGTLSDGTMIHVNAQNDTDNPLDVHGHFYIRGTLDGFPFTVQGEVVCLQVEGPLAALLGYVTKPKDFPFELVQIELLDGGEPPNDFAGFDFFQPICAHDFGIRPIQRGNYIVHDQISSLFLQSLLPQIAEFEQAAGDH